MTSAIRVGIVGANPTRGWARTAHLPALAALPGLELTAVSTTRLGSATETAARFGAAHAFDDARALAESGDVDVVTVSVKVPYHYEITKIALDAGKHVFTEWPLGVSTAQARELEELARARGVRHMIGLQGRKGATANYVRDLVAEGYVGRVRSVTLSIASPGRGGTSVTPDRIWAADRANGVGMLTISAGHALDTLRYSLGEISEVSAIVATLDPVATVAGSGETIQVTSPDNVLLNGRLAGGALLAAHFVSAPHGSGMRWSVLGDRGALTVTGTGLPHLADAGLILRGTDGEGPLRELDIPASYYRVPPEVPEGPPRNVAALYLALADAIHADRQPDPDFTTAVSLHHLIDTIQASSDSGTLLAV
jgi:predicted dehydrogenase